MIVRRTLKGIISKRAPHINRETPFAIAPKDPESVKKASSRCTDPPYYLQLKAMYIPKVDEKAIRTNSR